MRDQDLRVAEIPDAAELMTREWEGLDEGLTWRRYEMERDRLHQWEELMNKPLGADIFHGQCFSKVGSVYFGPDPDGDGILITDADSAIRIPAANKEKTISAIKRAFRLNRAK